jgi:hypothetical protein
VITCSQVNAQFSNDLTSAANVVHADEKLTAFLELEAAIRASNGHDRAAVPV